MIGCQSDAGSDNDNTNTVVSQMDTTINHCYIYNEPGYEETLELYITGNKVSGRGLRVEQRAYKLFNLSIDGTIKNGQVDVSISIVPKLNPEQSQTIYETWAFNDNQLIVKKRRYLDKQADLEFVKINCSNTSEDKKDSTLFDYFGGYTEDYAVVMRNGRYGLMHRDGKITIPFKYQDLSIVNEGSIVFYDEILARKGILDVNGNVLVPAEYSEIHCFNEGMAAFLDENGLWGFMDRQKKVVIQPSFSSINVFPEEPTRHPFNEGLANVQTESGWNYIDTKGNIAIQGDYIFAKQFINGKAEVLKNSKGYFIDKQGNCVENCD